ncbi:hypothetical protein [Proteus sp. G2671]|uniref:hypothetical protein n=1 Tax=Proteus sp. G2671 TaxID=2698883 RepID=UPI001378E199|nr:hypothetical protein [Proteus sp. G2671]NBM04346.1 hypothetical protein [Proteus sp. G2671]
MQKKPVFIDRIKVIVTMKNGELIYGYTTLPCDIKDEGKFIELSTDKCGLDVIYVNKDEISYVKFSFIIKE